MHDQPTDDFSFQGVAPDDRANESSAAREDAEQAMPSPPAPLPAPRTAEHPNAPNAAAPVPMAAASQVHQFQASHDESRQTHEHVAGPVPGQLGAQGGRVPAIDADDHARRGPPVHRSE